MNSRQLDTLRQLAAKGGTIYNSDSSLDWRTLSALKRRGLVEYARDYPAPFSELVSGLQLTADGWAVIEADRPDCQGASEAERARALECYH